MKNLIKLLLLPTLLLFASLTYAFNPPSIVYRCDTRSIDEINAAGGFFPKDYLGIRDYDLINHFDGTAPDGYVSGFVSVSYTLRHVINHCIGQTTPNQPTYIYMIVPGNNFYNISASLLAARDALPVGDIRRRNIQYLIGQFDNMDEYIARDGFPNGRILNYAVLNEEMIEEYYHGDEENSELYTSDFWDRRWVHNEEWNDQYDGEVASSDIYPVVDETASDVLFALTNHNIEIPIRFTCQLGSSANIRKLATDFCHIYPVVKKLSDIKKITALHIITHKGE